MKLFAILITLFAARSARVVNSWAGDYNASSSVQVAAGDEQRPLYLPYPPATMDFFSICQCKGEEFYKAMQSSSAEAGKLFNPPRDTSESLHGDTSSLSTWAWKDATVQPTYLSFDKAWGIDHVLRAIGVSDKAISNGGDIHVVKVAHGDADTDAAGYGTSLYNSQPEYDVGGKKFHVTGSEYTFGFDPSGGVLLAMNRKSPKYAGRQRSPKIEGIGLPELQSFSDIAWLKWKAIMGSAPLSIRFFASLSITNLETNGIISFVLGKAGFTEVPAWPGHSFDASSESGAALLGAPNALAFSYFLIQHKASLGPLEISKVTLFKDSKKFPDTNMLFHVERVVPDDTQGALRAHL